MVYIDYLINLFKVLIVPLVVILVVPLFLAIFNLLGMKTYGWLLLGIMIITSLVSGFMIGKKSNKRGYIS